MTTHSRETIVLVHGTFSGPREGERQWWQGGLDGDFASRLHGALAKRGIDVRCWSHSADPLFHWSGENDWVARVEASAALRQHISELANEGWRCHLVGHSHGGNVIVESLNAMHGRPEERAVASVVTLGTPFLDILDDVDPYKRKARWRAASMFGIATLVVVTAMLPSLATIWNGGWGAQLLVGSVIAMFAVTVASALTIILKDRARRKRGKLTAPVPALALNSQFDEAWQLLHHVRETPNPLAVPGGLWRYLGRQMRAYVVRRQAVQKGDHALRWAGRAVGGLALNCRGYWSAWHTPSWPLSCSACSSSP
jgi:hypothetical protein